MVRASAFGDVRIMVPMVSSVAELKWVREMLDKAIAQVRQAGHSIADHIPLRVMIEVPPVMSVPLTHPSIRSTRSPVSTSFV